MILQVTENTAYILDECGVLTTYRGETFVKGAGYIKTYFVPLDEDYRLIKKEQSVEYYRVNDRSQYHVLNNAVSSDESETDDDKSQCSTYKVRNMSVHDDGNDDYLIVSDVGDNYINKSDKSGDKIGDKSDSNEMRAAAPTDDCDSYKSIEHEVIETRC